MANVRNSNTIYVDSTGSLITDLNVRVSYIVLTSNAAADNLILKDKDTNGALKISLKNKNADETTMHDFSKRPLVFPNGIHADTITAGATATIVYSILTQEG